MIESMISISTPLFKHEMDSIPFDREFNAKVLIIHKNVKVNAVYLLFLKLKLCNCQVQKPLSAQQWQTKQTTYFDAICVRYVFE